MVLTSAPTAARTVAPAAPWSPCMAVTCPWGQSAGGHHGGEGGVRYISQTPHCTPAVALALSALTTP